MNLLRINYIYFDFRLFMRRFLNWILKTVVPRLDLLIAIQHLLVGLLFRSMVSLQILDYLTENLCKHLYWHSR